MNERSADIHIEQLPNGYWLGTVTVRVATMPEPMEFRGDSFHNAAEALDWARLMVENAVRYA